MVTRSTLSVALLLLSLGTIRGQDKETFPPGNPPIVLIASQIDADGNLVLVQYNTIHIQPASQSVGGPIYNERSLRKVALKGVTIYSGDGKEVAIETARKRLGDKETPILASSWKEQLPAFYRGVFKDDVLLFAFPQESPKWKAIQANDVPVRK